MLCIVLHANLEEPADAALVSVVTFSLTTLKAPVSVAVFVRLAVERFAAVALARPYRSVEEFGGGFVQNDVGRPTTSRLLIFASARTMEPPAVVS